MAVTTTGHDESLGLAKLRLGLRPCPVAWKNTQGCNITWQIAPVAYDIISRKMSYQVLHVL
jgi:hypothetical protein